jgi:hypothetical protein
MFVGQLDRFSERLARTQRFLPLVRHSRESGNPVRLRFPLSRE